MTLETKGGRPAGCDAEDEAGQQGNMLVTRLEMMRASKADHDSGDEVKLASLTKREEVESLWGALPTRSWKIQRLQGRRARTASKTGEQERRARTPMRETTLDNKATCRQLG